MSTRMLLGSVTLLSLVVGCAKVENRPAPEANSAEFDFPRPQPTASTSTASDGPLPVELEGFDYSPQREQELLKQVAQSPHDTKSLLHLARLNQVKAEGSNDEYDAFKKSAGYVHQALEADPAIVDTEVFRDIAGTAFYNEACAYSQDKQADASLKSLKLALEYEDLSQLRESEKSFLQRLSADSDFDYVRRNQGAAFQELIRETQLARATGAVDALFQQKHDFAFDFDLNDVDGQRLTKKDFAGKLLMVNVWGTWCPPCRAELPDLIAAHEKFKSQGFEIVGLNRESESGDEADRLIKKVQQQMGITYPCALVSDEILSQIPNLQGFPTSLFLDRRGRVLAMTVGMIDGLKLELIVERLLKDSSSEAADSDAAK